MPGKTELIERYVGIWNEPDADVRRGTIRQLWTEDARHILQPPQEIRDSASGLGLTATLEARGHDELEVRVRRAYEEFVASGKFRFRYRGNGDRLHEVVKFDWEMVSVDDGEVAGVGLEILLLAADGRIRRDYQFIEG